MIQLPMKKPFNTKWKIVVDAEMDAIKRNPTWSLVDVPTGCREIGVKKIFKTKYIEHGEVDKFKARLVANSGVASNYVWGGPNSQVQTINEMNEYGHSLFMFVRLSLKERTRTLKQTKILVCVRSFIKNLVHSFKC